MSNKRDYLIGQKVRLVGSSQERVADLRGKIGYVTNTVPDEENIIFPDQQLLFVEFPDVTPSMGMNGFGWALTSGEVELAEEDVA